jgi:hypothetical protein
MFDGMGYVREKAKAGIYGIGWDAMTKLVGKQRKERRAAL